MCRFVSPSTIAREGRKMTERYVARRTPHKTSRTSSLSQTVSCICQKHAVPVPLTHVHHSRRTVPHKQFPQSVVNNGCHWMSDCLARVPPSTRKRPRCPKISQDAHLNTGPDTQTNPRLRAGPPSPSESATECAFAIGKHFAATKSDRVSTVRVERMSHGLHMFTPTNVCLFVRSFVRSSVRPSFVRSSVRIFVFVVFSSRGAKQLTCT